MKRFIVACSMLLALTVCLSLQAQEVTIGIDFSTTGASSSLGIPNKNAMMIAPTMKTHRPCRFRMLPSALMRSL